MDILDEAIFIVWIEKKLLTVWTLAMVSQSTVMRLKSSCDLEEPKDSQPQESAAPFDSKDCEEKNLEPNDSQDPDYSDSEDEDSDSEKTLRLDDFKAEEIQDEKAINTKEASAVESEETGDFFGRKMRVAYGPGYGPGSLDVGSLQALLGGFMAKNTLETYVAGYSEHLSNAPASSTSSSKPKEMSKSGRKKKGKTSKGKAKKWRSIGILNRSWRGLDGSAYIFWDHD